MTYLGEVENGIVVLKDAPALAEGALVRVQVVETPPRRPRRGSIEALKSFQGGWAGGDEELDRLLGDVQRDRKADTISTDDSSLDH